MNNQAPKVSIGMPVYNGERFIREALDSLLGQTFTDFELIVSDNASTDGTEVICREYAARDMRIRYVRHAANLGSIANFKFVLDEATGEYFMWAAADDKWMPAFISECAGLLDDDTGIGFAVTGYTVTSMLNPLFDMKRLPDLDFVSDPDREKRVFRYSSLPFKTHKDNLIYGLWRREVIKEILARIKRSPLNKILIGSSMNEYALSLHRAGFVNKPLFQKRYRYFPPGTRIDLIIGALSRILYRLTGREIVDSNLSFAEQHLNDLGAVLRLGGFDEDYVSRVVGANRYHLKFGRDICARQEAEIK